MGGRRVTLAGLAAGPPLDVVVVGGGVNGSGVALAAASAGLRVALFEADDLGSGTSWRSTKLVHGGLRYLEHADLRLVRESLRERERLLRERPWLVKPLRFLVPSLPWSRRPPWQVGVGLFVYDLLSGRSSMPRHRRLSRETSLELVPGLNPSLQSAFGFFDARLEAPERLAIELAMEARQAGARVFNHSPVTAIGLSGGRVSSVSVEWGEERADIATRAVVNATGPWSDLVASLVPGTPSAIETTRGTHVMLDLGEQRMRAGVLSTARVDGRVFFAVPRGGLVLVGTTDEKVTHRPEEARPTAADVDYLLAEANALFPGRSIGYGDVVYSFAGLRSLARSKGSEAGSISRRLHVVDHRRDGGPEGFLSVVGGKLSTYRSAGLAVLRSLGVDPPGEERHAEPASDWREVAADLARDGAEFRRLGAYGPRLPDIRAIGVERVCDVCGLMDGEVIHAVREEKAATVADVVARRSGTAWLSGRGLCCHATVAGLIADEQGWSGARTKEEVDAYSEFVATNLPRPEGPPGE